jgi:hypothetical protein
MQIIALYGFRYLGAMLQRDLHNYIIGPTYFTFPIFLPQELIIFNLSSQDRLQNSPEITFHAYLSE